jgi:hypothetical protein
MKKHIKKIFFGVFAFWFGVCASFGFVGSFASAQSNSCENFNSASYTISNNAGNSRFLINTPIKTNLALKTKNSTAGGDNVDIVLVMDRSGSMGVRVNGQQKIQVAKDALNTIVDVVAQSGNLNNRIALVTFSSNVTLDQSLTNNYNAVKVAINSMTPGGTTSIGGGLVGASSELRTNSSNPATRKFIILASDGLQNHPPGIDTGIATVPSDATVYTVGIGDDADTAALQKIASTAGAGNGLYFPSNVTDLVAVFQNIITKILGAFTLQDVSLTFTRDDLVYTSFVKTLPVNDSYNSANGVLQWNNLGNMVNGQQKNIAIDYEGIKVGKSIPLDTFPLVLKYTISGTKCSENVPVNVLFVDVVDNTPPPPTCRDTTWSPNPSTVCTTQTFTQTSNCGTARSSRGTKYCTQCSDSIDNDNDVFIDYPLDRGCSSLLDNNEQNQNVIFFEF